MKEYNRFEVFVSLDKFDLNDAVNSVLNYKGFKDVDSGALHLNVSYVVYVLNHLNNVRLSFDVLSNLIKMDDFDYWSCRIMIERHDEYKFSHAEFRGYAQWFYPAQGEDKNEEMMLNAWNHHQKHHPHHYQYWLLTEGVDTKPLPMPFSALFDMLCDWAAMSFEFGNKPSEWFNDNKKKMIFHSKTIDSIERFLPKVDKAVEIMIKNKK